MQENINRGRPKSKLDLPEGWQDTILELYAVGASDVEIRVLISDWRGTFSEDLWYRWLNDEPDFSQTIKRGRELSRRWWEKEARTSLRDKEFNSVLWYMNMKNRFGWMDRQDHTTKGEKIGSLNELLTTAGQDSTE